MKFSEKNISTNKVPISHDDAKPNYNAFISGILSDPSTTKEERERIVDLLLKERDKGFVTEERLFQIIDELKNTGKNRDNKMELSNLKSIDPINTADFLSQFNKPLGLKYLTHDFDYAQDGRPNNINSLKKQAKSVINRYKEKLPVSLVALVRAFVEGPKETWWDTFGGKHKSFICDPEWILWSNSYNKHPINNPDYAKEIMSFRSTIRCVPPLFDEIVSQLSKDFPKLKIQKLMLDKLDFYTNTYILFQAVRRVLSTMNAHSEQYSDVKIDFLREIDREGRMQRIIRIHQIGSFAEKSLEDAVQRLERSDEAGDFGSIRNILNGYCLWQVETKWAGMPYRWNILRNDSQIAEFEKLDNDSVTGFTHKLIFYIL